MFSLPFYCIIIAAAVVVAVVVYSNFNEISSLFDSIGYVGSVFKFNVS